jgi:glycosyltransferase involved in cell wall biosynthesis
MSLPRAIAVDGRSLCGQRTGVGTYTSNLLEQLLLLDPSIRILLLLHEDPLPAVWMRDDRVQILKIPSFSGNNFLWTNISLARRLKTSACDIFHSPGYTLPLRLPVPSVVTIHDISYAAHPEWYPYRNGALRKAWYRLSARSADCILTVSEFSSREIMRVYGIPQEKISVIPLGVDRRRFGKIIQPQAQENLKYRYGLANDFLLFVGDIHRRRNVERIVEAFQSVRERRPRDLDLVLIGRIMEPVVSSMTDSPQNRHVRLLGYVQEEELALFYRIARAFVFPSFYEGFGLGVLEAMACGCPVIVGRGTACEEVAGEAAVVVDPADVKSIADAIAAILENQEMAAQHSEAGLKRAEQFTWRRTAEQTLSIYQRLAGSGLTGGI